MPNKRRIDVMVSSTTKDLADHRKQVNDAILRLRWTPLAMEYDEAVPGEDAISYSLKLVDEAEVYVGIFGVRYGFQPKDPRNEDDISITEMEYRRAVERGIPILIFIMDMDKHHVPASFLDDETATDRRKLKHFKDELGSKHIVSFFESAEDLRPKVFQSLFKLQQSGTFDSDDEDTADEPEPEPDTVLPNPPALYADPPYTLTTQFIGRTDELRQLDAWAASSDPMMIVEAIGGMGKSAVIWEWVQNHAIPAGDYAGIMWWSFYESGATMKAFVRHALAYVTGKNPADLRGGDLRQMTKDLTRTLEKGRYLLVLDGLERVLVAYHRWDAAQMRDDNVEDAESIIKDRDIRACTDPKDADVLKLLLACTKSKFLLSSRLLPLALEDRAGNPSKGVQHIHLNGLHLADALTLTRKLGVTVSDELQFDLFMKSFGYHSLLVTLVAGLVNKFRRGRGDFDAWYAANGRDFRLDDVDLKASQTHVLEVAFKGLEPDQIKFLAQVAAFGDAVEYEKLELFNPFLLLNETLNRGKALYLFDDMLTELEDRGLLRWGREKDIYDMHPVVRGYAYTFLQGDDKKATYETIGAYLETSTDLLKEQNASDLSELTNTIGIYQALLGVGRYDEAVAFFDSRLRDKLGRNFAAYHTIVELLTPLFREGTDALPPLFDTYNQSSVTTTLASMYTYLGKRKEAEQLQALQIKLKIDTKDYTNLNVGLRNLSVSMRNRNRFAISEKLRLAALELAKAMDNSKLIERSMLHLLISYVDTGQWQYVEDLTETLEDAYQEDTFWLADIMLRKAQTYTYTNIDATKFILKAEELALASGNASIYRNAVGLRGELALIQGATDQAILHFEKSIMLHRKAGTIEGWVIGGLARALTLQGKTSKALSILDDFEFDYASASAAEVYQLIGEHDLARSRAINAYRWAWGDGPPYVFWWVLERAKAVLDALGEPYPEMPPFDPAQVGKFPYEDEVRAIIERERAKRDAEADDE